MQAKINSRKSIFFVLMLISVLTLTVFNNCAKAVFSTGGSKVAELAPSEVILGVIDDCQAARDKGQLVIAEQIVRLEDTAVESGRPGDICEFGKDDNLSMKNGELRARYTQSRALNLPDRAVLCNLSIGSDTQSFKYDDVFFLNFNGHLLASNDKTAINDRLSLLPLSLPKAKKTINVYQYDWLKVRGAPFQNQTRDDYCLGSEDGVSTCSWPLTEQSGKINLNFSQEILIAMSANQPRQELQFAITGDNDPKIDCYHQRLDLRAIVEYFVPAQ